MLRPILALKLPLPRAAAPPRRVFTQSGDVLGGILDSPNIAIRCKSVKPLKGKSAARHQVLDP